MKSNLEIKTFLEKELSSLNKSLKPLDNATFNSISEFEEEEMIEFSKLEVQRDLIKYILDFIKG